MLTRHPTFEQLTELAEGRLVAEHRPSLLQHLAGCRRCAADLRWLEDTLAMMRADDTPAVPDHIVNRAVRLARQHRAQRQPEAPTLVRRLAAVLRFDSATAAPAFGLRAGTAHAPRQLIFEAEPYALDLRASLQRGGWTLTGQLLGPAEAEQGWVELSGEAAAVRADLTDLLEFGLPPVPGGTYHLRLHLATAQIDISPLELEP